MLIINIFVFKTLVHLLNRIEYSLKYSNNKDQLLNICIKENTML